jgi:protein MpaA
VTLLDRAIIPAIVLVFAGSLILANQKPADESTNGCMESIVVGKSNMGFAIELCHVGGSQIDSENSILVIGSVHGNEPAGKKVVDELVEMGAASETNLWIIRDGNPDGSLRATRQNANGVDLNRNFPTNWLPAEVGAKTYSGTNPASEPETQALMRAIDLVKPKIVITIHQPYGLVDCSMGADPNLDEKLAELTGLPATCIPGELADSPTNTYTGTITQWVNERYLDSTALALELGPTVDQAQTLKFAKALQTLFSVN